MAGERDRIINLTQYMESLGISVNIGVNNARGNKGFFKALNNRFRIDISKNLDNSEVLRVLVHEFAHFVYHQNNDFINLSKEYEEELLNLTVDSIPKASIEPLFRQRMALKEDISNISKRIKVLYPDIKLSDKKNKLIKEISKSDLKYLLKYDAVKVLKGFSTKIYSIKNLKQDFGEINPIHMDYIKLCSAKRKLNRINSRIARLNRYYNTPTELFARSIEYYMLNPDYMRTKTPDLYNFYNKQLSKSKVLSDFAEMCKDK